MAVELPSAGLIMAAWAALAALMLNTLSERPVESIAGLGLLLLGVPVYLFWKRRQPVAA